MNNSNKIYVAIIIGLLIIIAFMLGQCSANKQNTSHTPKNNYTTEEQTTNSHKTTPKPTINNTNHQQQPIDILTSETTVISYVKEHKQLPDCYVTKREAKNAGWDPSQGNLCDVLPGKAIGGDVFTNREGTLPDGKWFEADLNYNCGHRGKDRLVFNNQGDCYVTYNHYKTFEQK